MSLRETEAIEDMQKVLARIENRAPGYNSGWLVVMGVGALLKAQIVMMEEREEEELFERFRQAKERTRPSEAGTDPTGGETEGLQGQV